MFAHQVIEDCMAYGQRLIMAGITKDGIRQAMLSLIHDSVPYIGKAQKFYIGDVHNVDLAKERLIEGTRESLRLPYDTMYIDAIAPSHKDVSKIAAIFTPLQNEPGYVIVPFDFRRNIGSWIPSMGFIKFHQSTKTWDTFVIKGITIDHDQARKWLHSICDVMYATLLLLNCKNITTEKIPAPEALNKKRRKAGKQELFDYHVLNVVVPSKKRDYREASTPLSHNRVHLCRGHFKEYTAEHPLFGRYTGLYWWQPHVRGQNKGGIVMKDYNVKYSE